MSAADTHAAIDAIWRIESSKIIAYLNHFGGTEQNELLIHPAYQPVINLLDVDEGSNHRDQKREKRCCIKRTLGMPKPMRD